MIILSKNEDFSILMARIVAKFNNINFLSDLMARCTTCIQLKENSNGTIDYDSKFLEATQGLILLASLNTTGTSNEAQAQLKQKYPQYITDISTCLSFNSKVQAQKLLVSTPYLSEDLTFCLIQYAFYALVLIDKKIYRRFETAYTLWKNSLSVGFVGFETLHGEIIALSSYITFFGGNIFYIDPKEGEIFRFSRSGTSLRNKKITGLKVIEISGLQQICAECSDSSLVPLIVYDDYNLSKIVYPIAKTGSDMRKSERLTKRQAGRIVKETPWHTVQLGEIMGSQHTMRSHILIGLMYYELDVMKFCVMEGQSIFTVDHIDGGHANNKLINLQLLTRKSNEDKKNNHALWVFDYFRYWSKNIKKCYEIEENWRFRLAN